MRVSGYRSVILSGRFRWVFDLSLPYTHYFNFSSRRIPCVGWPFPPHTWTSSFVFKGLVSHWDIYNRHFYTCMLPVFVLSSCYGHFPWSPFMLSFSNGTYYLIPTHLALFSLSLFSTRLLWYSCISSCVHFFYPLFYPYYKLLYPVLYSN